MDDLAGTGSHPDARPGPIVLVGIAGLALGAGQPLTMSWLAETAPTGYRGTAMSLRLMANRVGQVALPGAIGLVAAGAGVTGVLGVTAAGLVTAGVFLGNTTVDPHEPEADQ